jgi:tetratricopeptide (TPR) repeat protein
LEKAGPGLVRFRNQCFRQVAYDTLPFARRRELHARVGDFLERSMTGNVDERASALSLHFLYAQRYEQCWRYAQIAARHAESRYANAEAAELYERALGASRKLPGIAADELARVFESLGDVALLAGLFERASWAFARARRLHADDPSGLVGLCHKQARVALHLGRRNTADRWISRGLRLLGDQPTGEQRARRAALRTMFANNRQLAGRPRLTRRWALLAIEDGIASDNRGALASAYLLLDWALITMGKPEDAHHARLALEIWTEKGDVGRQAEALTYLGYFAYLRGDWDDALQQWTRATDAYERAGNTIDAALGVSNSAELLIGQGRYDEAEPMLRTALEVWRAARYPAVTGVLCHQAKIAMYRGDVDTAAALFDDVQDRARSLGGTLDIDVASGRAECWLLQGEPRPALDLVDEALRAEAATGGAAFAARLHRLRAFSLAALGCPDAARADLDRSVSIARDQGATFELAMSLDALCAFGDAYGDPLDGRVADERTTLFRQLGVVARPPSLLEVAGTVGVRPVGVSSLSPAGWGR